MKDVLVVIKSLVDPSKLLVELCDSLCLVTTATAFIYYHLGVSDLKLLRTFYFVASLRGKN